MTDPRAIGVYIHAPFCRRRCSYCDFAVVFGHESLVPDYEAALRAEIDNFARRRGRREVDTIHFGGGTPSLLDPTLVVRILDAVRRTFDVRPGAEIALESNPEDLHEETLTAWREAGVTRLTVGLQALDPAGLAAIGRTGDVAANLAALDRAVGCGFVSVGADLIFGRPGQDPVSWALELEQVARLPVNHLSLYALETDGRSPLAVLIQRGRAPAPDPDAAAEMYETAVRRLAAAGFTRYEVSNFSRPGHESRHNLKYWQDEPYAGFGLSAASYIDGERFANPRRLPEYLALAERGFDRPDCEPYEADRRAGEAIVFGLRRSSGVDLDAIAARHGPGPVGRRRTAIDEAVRCGLLVRDGPRLRVADDAVLIANEALAEIL